MAMPDLSVGPRAERVPAMAAWLQRHGITYDATAGDDGIRKAWRAEKKRREKQAKRSEHDFAARILGETLPSSQARAARRKRQRELISLDLLLEYAMSPGLRSAVCERYKAPKKFALLTCTGGRRNLLLAPDLRGRASALAINPLIQRSLSLDVCRLPCVLSRRCLRARGPVQCRTDGIA